MSVVQFCRLCTELCTESLNLFQQKEKELLQQIKNVTGISLQNTDDMPQHICENCQVNLENAHKFREQCINSQKYFSTTEYKTKIKSEKEKIETNSLYEYSNDEITIEAYEKMEYYPLPLYVVGEEKPVNSSITQVKIETGEDLPVEQNLIVRVKKEYIEDIPVNRNEIEFMELSKKKESDANVQQILDNLETPYSKTDYTAQKKCNLANDATQLEMKLYTQMHSRDFGANLNCEECGKKMKNQQNLNEHIKRIHRGEKPFSCEYCGKKFFTKQNMKTHTYIHTGQRPANLNCEECGKQMSTISHLNRHIKRIHRGERPFSCELCEKKFAWRNNLTGHMQKHTGERPFSCELCEKNFAKTSDLTQHTKRKHTGERPFSCEYCEKKFTSKSELTRHTRKHTGEKPFSCEFCGKKFTTKHSVKMHTRKHTGDRPLSSEEV